MRFLIEENDLIVRTENYQISNKTYHKQTNEGNEAIATERIVQHDFDIYILYISNLKFVRRIPLYM